MQSSAAVVGRALVMLACVVGIPMAALSGASWSDMLEKLQNFQENHWPAAFQAASASDSSSAPLASKEPSLLSSSDNVGTASKPSDPPAVPLARPIQSAVIPVGFQSPAEPVSPKAAEISPTNQNVPDDLRLDSNPFVSIQQRLRELGATYYLLESWGNGRQMYRFYCKISIGGNADYTRCFEATQADPLQAMVQVLRQVEGIKQTVQRESGQWPVASGP
jgi:hypothetical protein